MSLTLALVSAAHADAWRRYNIDQTLDAIADQARAAGWNVKRLDPAAIEAKARSSIPLITGPGSASITRALRTGRHLAQSGALEGADIIVGPLAGGLLQPTLMTRATGEGLLASTIVLLSEAPTTARLSDPLDGRPCPGLLVDDALERSAISLCDAVAGGARPNGAQAVASAASPAAAIGALRRPVKAPPRQPRVAANMPTEIVFVGPASQRYGLSQFLDAIEALADELARSATLISFIGPWGADDPALSKALLGVRSQAWPFLFRVIDTDDPTIVLRHGADARRLLVFAGEATDDEILLRQALETCPAVMFSDAHPVGEDDALNAWTFKAGAKGLADGLRRRLSAPLAAPPRRTPDDWPSALATLSMAAARPATVSVTPRVSLCVTHRDRPEQLRRAIASRAEAGAGIVETIVVDSGSRLKDTEPTLATLERSGVIVIRSEKMIAQGVARNIAASVAGGDVLIFLDDDNRLSINGGQRLAEPIAAGRFDVVVSTLDLFDGEAGIGDPAARLTFLGDAGTAGLMFNGFGDGNFAISRACFMALGGYETGDVAAFDWVFLAKARARGYRIGVLQTPAIHYARTLEGGQGNWRKLDRWGSRRAVLEAYSGHYDAQLLAYGLQALTLSCFD